MSFSHRPRTEWAPNASANLLRLGWLTGCWEREEDGGVTQEQWMRPLGRTMIGMSRTVRRAAENAESRTVAFEFLRIEERGDTGELFYVAVPSGQAETAFKLVELTDSLAVFENPEHDFPQRIRYRRLPGDSLLAQIEGDRGGTLRVIDFPLKRVHCD